MGVAEGLDVSVYSPRSGTRRARGMNRRPAAYKLARITLIPVTPRGSCAPSSYGYSNHRKVSGIVRCRNHGGRLWPAANLRLRPGVASGTVTRFPPDRFGHGYGDPRKDWLLPIRGNDHLQLARSPELVTTYTGTAFHAGYTAAIATAACCSRPILCQSMLDTRCRRRPPLNGGTPPRRRGFTRCATLPQCFGS
jgi:hypothetical protein